MLLLPALLLLVSCGKFLEPKSEDEFVPESVTSLDELLLYESYYRNGASLTPFFTLLSDDAAVVPFVGSGDLLTPVHLTSLRSVYTWQPDAYEVMDEDRVEEGYYDIYSACYKRILGCNAVLDYLPGVSGEEQDRIRVEAEACALRGFYYFHLVNCYGMPYNYNKESLGVPLHLHSAVSSTAIARNTVEEVYEQVLKDLKHAEQLYESLPEDLQWKPNMRVSLPFVQQLLSRVYLYMEEWALASDYAGKVIRDSRFRLIDRLEFPQADRSYFNFHSYVNPEVIWPYGEASYLYFFEAPYMLNVGLGGNVAFVVASTDLVYLLNRGPVVGDIRSKQYLIQDLRSVNSLPYSKFKLNESNLLPDLSSGYFARSFRLSEAYLNRAEAEGMLYWKEGGDDHKTEALRLFDELRARRMEHPEYVKDDMDARTPERLVNSIRNERRRELCFEDHRWFDLRRYGMPEIQHIWYEGPNTSSAVRYTLKHNDPHYTLQIPTSVLLYNSLMEQNPKGPVRID